MKTSGMSEDQVRRDFDIFVNQYPTGEFYISSLSLLMGYEHSMLNHTFVFEVKFIERQFRRHEAHSFQADGLQDAAHQLGREDGESRAEGLR